MPVNYWLSTKATVPGINNVQYSAGDALGTKISLTNLPASGIISLIALTDLADQGAAFDILLFNADITTGTNNTAYDMADADAAKFIGHIVVVAGNYSSLSNNSVATQGGIGLAFESQDGLMFAQCVARGTPTYAAAGDVVFELVAEI